MTKTQILKTEELRIRLLKEFKGMFLYQLDTYRAILLGEFNRVEFVIIVFEEKYEIKCKNVSRSATTCEEVISFLTTFIMRSICL